MVMANPNAGCQVHGAPAMSQPSERAEDRPEEEPADGAIAAGDARQKQGEEDGAESPRRRGARPRRGCPSGDARLLDRPEAAV